MAVRVGFADAVRLGSWAPVAIDISNQGSDFSGILRVSFEGNQQYSFFGPPPAVYELAASFPHDSHKSLVINVAVPPVVRSNRLQVALLAGNRTVISREQQFIPISPGTDFCGALEGTVGSYDFLSRLAPASSQGHPVVASLTPQDLPSSTELLNGFDCLIIGDVSLQNVSTAQMNALEAWVERGGLLIITGGVNWRERVPYLPSNLLPVNVQGVTIQHNAGPLERFAPPGSDNNGLWAFASGPLNGGATVMGTPAAPALVTKRVGFGTIFYSAVDTSQAPASNWAGKTALWSYMLNYVTAPISAESFSGFRSLFSIPTAALSTLPSLADPIPYPLVLGLLLQAIFVIPLFWVMLKRFDRVAWIGMVAPFWFLAFTIFGIRYATLHQAGDVAEVQVSELSLASGSSVAAVTSYVGLFSPQQRFVDLVSSQGSLLKPARRSFTSFTSPNQPTDVTVDEGISTVASNVTLGPSAMTVFQVDSQQRLGNGVTTALHIGAHALSGTVTNHLGQDLHGAILVLGSQAIPIGTVPNGATYSFHGNFDTQASTNSLGSTQSVEKALESVRVPAFTGLGNAASTDIVLKALGHTSSQAVQRTGGSYIVGWIHDSADAVSLRRAHAVVRSIAVLVIPTPITVDTSLKTLESPLNQYVPLVRLGVTGALPQRFTVATGGSLAMEYDFPLQSATGARSLQLTVLGSYSGGSVLPRGVSLGTISFFDWTAQSWKTLPLVSGMNVYRDITDFVSPLGAVRVRYTYKPAANSHETGVDFSRFLLGLQVGP
ncbi:MAG: hypothetical protein M1396_03160 [Chloroflexi bacterium]|nr:hypothetical protein [Chloroflexota bacterium]